LRYGKIAICSDADFDGAHIGLLVMAIIQKLFPEFIQEKRLFWLKAPISKLDYKGKTWYYYSDEEIENRTQKVGDIVFFKGLGQMSGKDLTESLFNLTNQHLEQLIPTEEGISTLLMLMGEDVAPRKEFVQHIDFGGFNL
jgi:DNA gyrase/topoisomerase IV subunit B